MLLSIFFNIGTKPMKAIVAYISLLEHDAVVLGTGIVWHLYSRHKGIIFHNRMLFVLLESIWGGLNYLLKFFKRF